MSMAFKTRLITVLILTLLVLVAMMGCSQDTFEKPNEIIAPQTVAFSEANTELQIGESKSLAFYVYPKEASYAMINFLSSNNDVVEIDGYTVTGVADGESIITACYDGRIIGQCNIKVKQIEPERIWLDNDIIEEGVGHTISISINSYPTNITDTRYTYAVEDESVVKYEDGVFYAEKCGETTIHILHDSTGLTLECFVSVVPIEAESISIACYDSLIVGDSIPLKVFFYPEDTTDKTIIWKSSNKKIASIESATLYAHRTGSVTIKATTTSGAFAEKEIEILPVLPNKIKLSIKNNALTVGKNTTIKATVLPENATDVSLLWTSSDKSIATVDQNGNVKAIRPGVVRITAESSNGIKEAIVITVNPRPVSVSNGFIKKPKGERVAPVTIHAPKTESCYVYFENEHDSRYDFSLFVKAGTTTKVKVHTGTYTMYYATGENWYGTKYKFGVGTNYFMLDDVFLFYELGDYVYGTEVTLYKVNHGNIEAEPISESDFPG